ncbi:exosortase C-terminal domain/associated protein EpsI [uncultured Aquabacterium sp.]|uniref:exosortase C-terminal domain/associated protein EpsI n=1 Tax=uncultured Aquabacterium sp. TaxID=158753 RepID=UPI0025CD839A|nr:exosortase C-terminal domain/associated protein EpsI [uncultured Aquabacterium sp.]
MALLLLTLGYALQPRLTENTVDEATLNRLIPKSFGEWVEVKSTVPQVTTATDQALSDQQPYDAQVMRTYRHSSGQTVMIAIAYGRNQRQEIKVHRPEVCYAAAGRKVVSIAPTEFGIESGDGQPVIGMQMLTTLPRQEADELVLYWIRIGHTFSQSGLTQRLHILTEGLKGRRSDGILVRFSQIIPRNSDTAASKNLQQAFARELIAALPKEGRQLLIN